MPGQDFSGVPTPQRKTQSTGSKKDECFTCDTLEKYAGIAEGYTTAMSEALAEPMLNLFLALVGLWAVVTGFKFVMLKISAADVVQDLVSITIAYALLQVQGTDLITNIYKTSLLIMTGAATVAFSVGPKAPPIVEDGLRGLMMAGETGIREVLSFSLDTFDAATDMNSRLAVIAKGQVMLIRAQAQTNMLLAQMLKVQASRNIVYDVPMDAKPTGGQK